MPLASPITGIDHVAINVTDTERAKVFYGEFLGLEEIPRPPSFDFPGAWYRAGELVIHLVGRAEADAISARHFCFRVADLRAVETQFRAAGLEIKPAGHKIPGTDRFFIRDPDGNRLEFQGPDGSN